MRRTYDAHTAYTRPHTAHTEENGGKRKKTFLSFSFGVSGEVPGIELTLSDTM